MKFRNVTGHEIKLLVSVVNDTPYDPATIPNDGHAVVQGPIQKVILAQGPPLTLEVTTYAPWDAPNAVRSFEGGGSGEDGEVETVDSDGTDYLSRLQVENRTGGEVDFEVEVNAKVGNRDFLRPDVTDLQLRRHNAGPLTVKMWKK